VLKLYGRFQAVRRRYIDTPITVFVGWAVVMLVNVH